MIPLKTLGEPYVELRKAIVPVELLRGAWYWKIETRPWFIYGPAEWKPLPGTVILSVR